MQYYDKQGLLTPSSETAGGRRLYSDADVSRLGQILALKSLGFSLDDIRDRLLALDSPLAVAAALTEREELLAKQIAALQQTLTAVAALRDETLLMGQVDFSRYALIVDLLAEPVLDHWFARHVSDEFIKRVETLGEQKSDQILATQQQLLKEATDLQAANVAPHSEVGITWATRWWNMIEDFTGGDLSLLPELDKLRPEIEESDAEYWSSFTAVETWLASALGAYFGRIGHNPFAGQDATTSRMC